MADNRTEVRAVLAPYRSEAEAYRSFGFGSPVRREVRPYRCHNSFNVCLTLPNANQSRTLLKHINSGGFGPKSGYNFLLLPDQLRFRNPKLRRRS